MYRDCILCIIYAYSGEIFLLRLTGSRNEFDTLLGIGTGEQTEGGEIHNSGVAAAGDDMAGREESRSEISIAEVRHEGDIRVRKRRGGAVGFALDDKDTLLRVGIAVEYMFFEKGALGFQAAQDGDYIIIGKLAV